MRRESQVKNCSGTTSSKILLTLAIALAVVVMPGIASAQYYDVFRVNYFANNVSAAPDATVRIDNPGLAGGNLCAMIYVFDNDQQLSECCGCFTTPDGLATLSVKKDLTSNPLTGVVSNNGVIEVVASELNGYPCDPTYDVLPTPNLRVWGTHVQNKVGSAYPITETEFSDSFLSGVELYNLQTECSFVNLLGSGHGQCTCGTGD
jgi:hypothetical protein